MELARSVNKAGSNASVFHLRHDPEKAVFELERGEFEGTSVYRARGNVDPTDPENYFFSREQNKLFEEVVNDTGAEVVHFLYFTGGLSLELPAFAADMGKKVYVTVTDFSGLCPRGQLLDRSGDRCPGPREGLRCMPCLFDMSVFTRSVRVDKVLREFMPLWLVPAEAGPELELVRRRLDAVRNAFKRARLVLFPNEHTRKLYHMAEIRAAKEMVLDYGIDLTGFRSHEKTASDTIRVGFIGQLLPHKGLHTLTEALSEISEDYRLVIYGNLEDPGAKEYYESLSIDKEKVEFRGTFPFEKMNEVLEGLHVLVVPSSWDENCPLIVKYAFATGTRAVLADQPGMVSDRERVPAGTAFFRPGSPTSLAEALSGALRGMSESGTDEGPGAIEKALSAGSVIDIDEQARNLLEIYGGEK